MNTWPSTGILTDPEDVFFCTRAEVAARLAGHAEPLEPETLAERRQRWQRQRGLAAPLTLGAPVRLIGDVIDRAVQEARGPREVPAGAIVGHPASAGRATGPVHIVHGPDDFAGFRDGDVLVAKATAPAWTPLFDEGRSRRHRRRHPRRPRLPGRPRVRHPRRGRDRRRHHPPVPGSAGHRRRRRRNRHPARSVSHEV